jgi:hypothetical protein
VPIEFDCIWRKSVPISEQEDYWDRAPVRDAADEVELSVYETKVSP